VSDHGDKRGDPRDRPPDPAGTQPKVDPATLAPSTSAPLIPTPRGVIDSTAEEVAVEPGEVMAAIAPAADGGDLLPARRAAGGVGPVASVEAPHAARFQFLLGMLIALAVAGIALAAGVIANNKSVRNVGWSAWHPSSPGITGAQQIAAHVAPEYRLPDGSQLALVSGGALQVAGLPVQLALNSGGNITILNGATVLYTMCGLGTNCALPGTPSGKRLLLVKREALELALYSFRYLGADDVVVFVPPVTSHSTAVPGQPARTVKATEAVFYRSGQLAPELGRPLGDTLSAHTPSVPTVTQTADAPLVAQLTSQSLYGFTFEQHSANASVFLVLAPLGG
jgi:hypothetical protein